MEKILDIKKLSYAGFLISVGIVYGDIGTSPLYTFRAIIQDSPIDSILVLGGASAIFWTLFFQTTLKYVIITLKADNKGEGGIFSLYTLIKRYKKWLIVPAILGGSFLIADSIITPPISVSSAIEGLKMYYPHIPVMPIVISIIVALFIMQSLGTTIIGRIFGPMMMIWFAMIGIFGFYALSFNFSVLKALNPWYAYQLIIFYPKGFWLLGAVFLCTTGAEALYSDLGHCGRKNIEASWIFIKTMLVLCYFGQAAWLLSQVGPIHADVNSFFAMMPQWMFWPAIFISTLAAIIASQALISGTFTLFNEAMRLNLFPKLIVEYPAEVRGQLYIPAVNWSLMSACICMVLFFKEAKYMEAAFGLSVTLTMLMTTILLIHYLLLKRAHLILIILFGVLYFLIEGSFLISNLQKFSHGGYITLLLGLLLFWVMFTWQYSRNIKKNLLNFIPIEPHMHALADLSRDISIPKYATHLVYMTESPHAGKIEERVMESVYYRHPKRADVYWFLHIEVTDEPYTTEYKVEVLEKDEVMRVVFYLGFRIVPRINLLFKQVLQDLYVSKEFSITDTEKSFYKKNPQGDCRFVVFETYLSRENELPLWKLIPLRLYYLFKKMEVPVQRSYGLDDSMTLLEKVPVLVEQRTAIHLRRKFYSE